MEVSKDLVTKLINNNIRSIVGKENGSHLGKLFTKS